MKKSFIGIGAILLLVLIGLGYYFYNDTRDPYVKGCDYDVPGANIPTFTEVPFDFFHKFDIKRSLPLLGSCLIDVDADGIDEVFVGGGNDQKDVVYKYRNGFFEDISDKVNLPEKYATATLGAVSFDMDDDGAVDFLLAREDGVWIFKNENGKFVASQLDIQLNEHSTPVSFALGDVNQDGFADIFLCNYIPVNKMEGQTIFNDNNYGASSLLLLNNGDLTFRDATEDLGLNYIHNTFQAVMVDLNDDGWLDLVVAYDTGEVRTYKNNMGSDFELMNNPLTGKYAYPMGIAVGDFNNDTQIDFFFSNTGSSVPAAVAKGDLEEDQELVLDWLLFRNEGDFNFTNVAEEAKVADFEFSWGCVFEDFNLDGRQDLVVAENYIDFPPHKAFKLPCRFLLQRENGTFSAVEEQANAVNKNYALTPLVSDFNDDGYPDLIYINLDGPVRALINDGGNHNYLKVKLKETSANSGTAAIVELENGSMLSDVYVIGEGLASDQTNTMTFGLGEATSVKSLTLKYPSGGRDTLLNPKINKTYIFSDTRKVDSNEKGIDL
jgi:hypothetical protein